MPYMEMTVEEWEAAYKRQLQRDIAEAVRWRDFYAERVVKLKKRLSACPADDDATPARRAG